MVSTSMLDAEEQFLAVRGDAEMRAANVRLADTKLVPDDVNAAILAISRDSEAMKTTHEWYTVYDKFGRPRRCSDDRLQSVLRARDGEGNLIFFARPPKDAPMIVTVDSLTWQPDIDQGDERKTKAFARRIEKTPVLVQVRCRICNKTIGENPHATAPTVGDLTFRAQTVLFRHAMEGVSRHPFAIRRLIQDPEVRAELFEGLRKGRA